MTFYFRGSASDVFKIIFLWFLLCFYHLLAIFAERNILDANGSNRISIIQTRKGFFLTPCHSY